MKKKFISAMLFGALLLASTSAVVSCKDYDDDISELRKQIEQKSTDLNSLLTKEIATATSSITQLQSSQSSLESAYAAADEALKKQIETAGNDANSYAALQAAQAQEAAIAAAKTLVSDAVTDLQANIDKANDAIATANDAIATANKAISDANAAIDKSATKEELEAVKQALLNADTELRASIEAAQQRADNAYTLAEQANKLATQNASDIKALQTKVAETAETAAANLKSVKEDLEKNIASINEDLKKLTTRVGDVEKTANQNAIDIKTINTQLKALKSSDSLIIANLADSSKTMRALVTANQKDIENKLANAVKNANDSINRAKVEAEAYAKLLVANANSRIDSTNVKIGKLSEAYTEADKAIYKRIDEVKDSLVEVINLYKDSQSKKDAAQDSIINDLEKALKAVANGDLEAFTKQVQGYEISISNLNDQVAKINKYLSVIDRQLKALVFNPLEYKDGIETIGIYSFEYVPFTGFAAADLTKDQQTADKDVKPASKAVSVMPLATASYWLNPSNARVELDKSNYKFLVHTAISRAKAISSSDMAIDSVAYDTNNEGLINVYFNMPEAALKNLADETDESQINVAALRYTYKATTGDTIITSDFARIERYKIENLIVNKVETEGTVDKNIACSQTDETSTTANFGHLYKTAKNAVSASDNNYIAIEYNNSTTGVDLNKWINVHYDLNDKHQVWGGQSTINKKNFELKYELIGYEDGTNKTNESGHATINGSILTVHKYGQPGVTAGKEIAGRKPLIRVQLIDKTKNQVAAYGYICAKIVKSAGQVVVNNLTPNYDPYYRACYDSKIHSQKTTWLEIEDKLLGQINMSKADFEKLYKIDGPSASASEAYIYTSSDEKTFTKDELGAYGSATYSKGVDDDAHETNILTWTVWGEKAYTTFEKDAKPSLDIYVKFISTTTGDEETEPIYVKLSWAPSAKNTTPSAGLTKADKKTANWHAEGSREEGEAEVHMQIGAPTSGTTAKFNQLTLDDTFNGTAAENSNKITAIIKADLKDYAALASSATATYQFKATQDATSYTVGSTTYKVYVDDTDYLTLYAYTKDDKTDKQKVATITADKGIVTINDESPYARAIINNEATKVSTLTKDTVLTLTIAVNATTCALTEADEKAGKLQAVDLGTTGEFNVKVIKPLYVDGISVDNMQWNDGTSLTKNVKVQFSDFVTYNPATFAEHSTSDVLTSLGVTVKGDWPKAFYTFYKITNYEVVTDKAKTNYTGSWNYIDKKDFSISFSNESRDKVTYPYYDWTETDGVYSGTGNIIIGTVTLKQVNQERTNTFMIKIPVTITYALGELTTEIPVTVNASK